MIASSLQRLEGRLELCQEHDHTTTSCANNCRERVARPELDDGKQTALDAVLKQQQTTSFNCITLSQNWVASIQGAKAEGGTSPWEASDAEIKDLELAVARGTFFPQSSLPCYGWS